MLLKINAGCNTPKAIVFDMPETYESGQSERRSLMAEHKKLDPKSDRAKELTSRLRAYKIWAREVWRLEMDALGECFDCDDFDYDLRSLLISVIHAIHLRSLTNFRDSKEYFAENPVENRLIAIANEWIRDRIVCDLADNPPAEILQYVIPDREPPTPTINKAEILKFVKGHSPRYAVNIIRHRFTSYDRDRFLEPYLRAFVRANMWIADNFPTLAHEAIAQVDEKMARQGKRA